MTHGATVGAGGLGCYRALIGTEELTARASGTLVLKPWRRFVPITLSVVALFAALYKYSVRARSMPSHCTLTHLKQVVVRTRMQTRYLPYVNSTDPDAIVVNVIVNLFE